MSALLAWLRLCEPALLRGAIVAVLALASSAGLAITDQQGEALTAAVLAVVALIQASSTRKAVYSPATANDPARAAELLDNTYDGPPAT